MKTNEDGEERSARLQARRGVLLLYPRQPRSHYLQSQAKLMMQEAYVSRLVNPCCITKTLSLGSAWPLAEKFVSSRKSRFRPKMATVSPKSVFQPRHDEA